MKQKQNRNLMIETLKGGKYKKGNLTETVNVKNGNLSETVNMKKVTLPKQGSVSVILRKQKRNRKVLVLPI
jgi:hypothetical protein